ncbi:MULTISPECIES: LTA synthase family protein [unclassified Microbulbifer]|uniref:LTA synthase family protein n=1 Tax=unclassified Microbulbifer TaxID=2619833 RepID=UPI0027E513A7|nr:MULTISPECIES: LTA synthase family protein [unclassified Microbulbifer]
MKRQLTHPTAGIRCLQPFFLFLLIGLALLSIARLGLITWQWPRVGEQGITGFLLLQGLRFDIVACSLLLLLPALATPLLALHPRSNALWQKLLTIYLSACFGFLLYMEMATPSFIDQYDLRPNILFVEYLRYPQEVASMLWKAYKLPILLAAVVIPLAVTLVYRSLRRVRSDSTTSPLSVLWMLPLVLVVGALGVRSTLDHRPVNPSTVAVSEDLMVNDLALNSTYSLLYAIYEARRDEKGKAVYGEMPREQVVRLVRENMRLPADSFTSEQLPTLHRQQPLKQRDKPLNLVIILQESMGAQFVGALGGRPLTPELDALADEGIWFENLYATGTRSVRGIEAVITGFTPTPARSVVKLGRSQRDFFTIAELLSRRGYDTSFIYGGESHFDNMARFFVANGFERIVDENDFANPVFEGSWGASDEDLFARAHEEFEKQGDKPFFSLVFTSSNHSPFEFPDGRIELYDAQKATENNTVKYADYAMGQFFRRAKQSNYWKDTLFLVIADHDARVRGASLVPIEHFHIPGLILGADVEPMRYKRVASQIDMLPTLLSLMGLSAEHPAIGHDLLRPELAGTPGRAMMQYNATQAYMEGDKVVIFERGKAPSQYRYQNGELEATEEEQSFVDEAMAHSLWGPLSYKERLYRLPAEPQMAGGGQQQGRHKIEAAK